MGSGHVSDSGKAPPGASVGRRTPTRFPLIQTQAGASEPGYAYTGREWDPGTGFYF
jgi:hypothetical protein